MEQLPEQELTEEGLVGIIWGILEMQKDIMERFPNIYEQTLERFNNLDVDAEFNRLINEQ